MLTTVSLELVNASHLAGRPFIMLSGGEKQHVLLTRACTQQTPALVVVGHEVLVTGASMR